MQQIKYLLATLLLIITASAQAQVGIGTASPAVTAQLDVSSTTKGFLPPRMTAIQRDAIAIPALGLIVYNSSSNALEIYTGSKWISLSLNSADALPTIQIGIQQWQVKNLETAFYKNGDPIPQVRDAAAWATLTTGAWCYYNNDSTLGTKYGKLYNWYAVNDARGLAPQGWHIPTDAEWTFLETTLGGSVAGEQMKEAGTASWLAFSTSGNNNSGFAGLPGGFSNENGYFAGLGSSCVFWSATEKDASNIWIHYLNFTLSGLIRDNNTKRNGFSVRCIRD